MSEPPESWQQSWQPDRPDMPDPVSLHKPDGTQPQADPPPDFDPYRFGAPEHPVPPEYAPPGYRPPPPTAPPSVPPPPGYATYPGYQQQHYAGYDQQGYPYGPPPPYTTQYPPPRTGNGKAIASLVLGIASILFCWLSVFDAIPVLLAFVFGAIARGETKHRPGREGHSPAVAGMVCAAVGAVLAIVLTIWFINRFSDCFKYDTGSSAYSHCVQNRL